MKVTTQSLHASLPCMMQPSHSIVSAVMPPGSREPVTKTLRPRTVAGNPIYGMATIGVPGGGAKVDAGGFDVYPPACIVIVSDLPPLDDPCE